MKKRNNTLIIWAIIGVSMMVMLGGCTMVVLIVAMSKSKQPIAKKQPVTPNQQAVIPEKPVVVPKQSVKTSTQLRMPVGYDDSKKNVRADLIQQMRVDGFISDIKWDGVVGQMRVGSKFMSANFEDRERVARLAMFWCLDQDVHCNLLIINHPQTNNRIGSVSSLSGWGLELK